jgi:hypothetical protein
MPFTEEQAKRASDFLSAYRDNLTCPLCGHKHFSVFNEVVRAPVVTVAEGAVGITLGQGLGAVAVTCQSCGLIRFFSAARMGLVEQS